MKKKAAKADVNAKSWKNVFQEKSAQLETSVANTCMQYMSQTSIAVEKLITQQETAQAAFNRNLQALQSTMATQQDSNKNMQQQLFDVTTSQLNSYRDEFEAF